MPNTLGRGEEFGTRHTADRAPQPVLIHDAEQTLTDPLLYVRRGGWAQAGNHASLHTVFF